LGEVDMTLAEALKANNENLAKYRELGDERAIEFCLNLKENILKSMGKEVAREYVELFGK
jgi:hypothetical protein